jgi:hypothetical protein
LTRPQVRGPRQQQANGLAQAAPEFRHLPGVPRIDDAALGLGHHALIADFGNNVSEARCQVDDNRPAVDSLVIAP